MTKLTLSDEDKVFQGVTNDETYAEAEAKRELFEEKKKLEQQLRDTKTQLSNLQEKIKIEAAKKLFVQKSDFLLREQLDRMEKFIVGINKHLLDGDRDGLARIINTELYNIHGMNTYLATPNTVDILYDYCRASVYKKIKDNNADFNRTNKELREIKVREADWIPFPTKESGDKKSQD